MGKLKTGMIGATLLLVFAPHAWGKDLQFKPYTFKADDGTTVAAQWGTLEVPLKHDMPGGKTIKLSFVRFKSTNPHPGNPIIYLAGGPGGSGIATARGKRFAMFMALRQVADVIALDQRGTGASDSIPPCVAPTAPPPAPTATTMGAYMDAAARHCMAFWRSKGIDISAYNTRENALDLDDLRQDLGAKKLNLWGISYGSTLALAALKILPESIGRAVLASPLDTYQTQRLPARTHDFLNRVDGLLKSDPALNQVYPDLLGTMKTVLDRLEQKPARITVRTAAGAEEKLAVTKFTIQMATVLMLKDPDQLRYLPIMYYAMAGGQFQEIANPLLVSFFSTPFPVDGMALGVRAAACLSRSRQALVEQQARSALLGNVLNFTGELFHNTGIPRLDGDICTPVKSDVPALVLTGTLDGRTYPEGHAEILKGLSNGAEVVIENAGHDLFMVSPKVTDDVVAFFSGDPAPYSQIRIPPPAFVMPPAAGAQKAD